MKTQKLLVIVASVCLMAFFNVVSFAQTDDVQPNIEPFLKGMLQAEEGQCDIWTVIQTLADFLHEQQDELEECEAQLEGCQGQQQGAPVPRTGQTQSYAAGDDGELQKGVQWPDPRFTDNANGTVTDNLTGLIWLQVGDTCYLNLTWSSALNTISELRDGECFLSDGSVAGDWRVPNIRELQSIVDYSKAEPALPSDTPIYVSAKQKSYWTSTTGSTSEAQAWMLNFQNGDASLQSKETSNGMYVIAVRGAN